jgi:membrane-bound lytic murein transglycosylase D
MYGRPKTFLVFGILAAALLAGCSSTIPTARLHSPFVPPVNRQQAVTLLPDPPEISGGWSVLDITPVLSETFHFSASRRAAEDLMQRANLRFQRGKGLYQANDTANARAEFDGAIDLMLAASAEDPGDRLEFSRRLDELVDAVHRYDLAGLGASDTEEGKFDRAPLEDILHMTFPVDPRLNAKVREQVAATASQLPLSVNDAVLGYINYFSKGGHRTIIDAIQRSGRYRPMIQRILDEEGVPQELLHLAQAESGFYARAMSRMAAGGMWQFLKSRGNEYGLKQSPYTDDRMDPEKATRAAARHLHDLYSEFGDWYLALAAYNCGPNLVENAVERTGYADFWELRGRNVLPAETTNYVPIILAMTIMEKNAAAYGLAGIQQDPPMVYDTVDISAKTSLALVSDIVDTPLPELQDLNPSLLRGMIPADYTLHVPKGAGTQLMAGLELIPPEHRDGWRMHRLGTGETLAAVGKRFGIGLNSLVAANHLQSPAASEGDRLIIPVAVRPAAPARRTSASATRGKAPVHSKTAAKPKPQPASKPAVMVAQSKSQ